MRRLLILLASLAATNACGQVPKGTPLRLMLLRDISSSSSKVGEVIPFLVTEDVKITGETLISEGTMVFAKLSQSRREGALSAPILDRPARLCLRFEHTRDHAGHEVPIWPKPDRPGELQITREMTQIHRSPEETRDYMLALENGESKPVMEKVRKLFSDRATSLTESEAQVLIKHNVPIPFVQEAIRAGAYGLVKGFINDIKSGRPIEAFLGLAPITRPAVLAIRAVRDLGRLSGGVCGYIGGRLKGRNIACVTGTELTVYAG